MLEIKKLLVVSAKNTKIITNNNPTSIYNKPKY